MRAFQLSIKVNYDIYYNPYIFLLINNKRSDNMLIFKDKNKN
ncbi:hypothetical protein SAMN02745355_0215 [Picrophilus oshimae DSM 9789]|uniref:Uncharacterized protein n=1 Tax=Picrophilus torridus (strain ATCC 700027 / DSM 9790 / JCM 10055 / NBRC 100828 / KAW 2/3) TaxID=1122961 RepID=A0A8G2FVQ9_PICTO|nr:hypothetical protein SAMN02745355_0215 [Picrophilus oshimae DSM 9789]